jgi:glycerol-3-phosphate dehydrogenase
MSAARSRSSRLIRPLLYLTAAGATGTTLLYFTYRPRDIPGSEAAAVPPPIYGEGGKFRLPDFPRVTSREDQISALQNTCASNKRRSRRRDWLDWAQNFVGQQEEPEVNGGEDEPYDLLIIGGGATGAGIALDAATRGLKVAVVERDDFSSGTSSKSTKLVHGGVRYLEKAVWELDYNQYEFLLLFHSSRNTDDSKI